MVVRDTSLECFYEILQSGLIGERESLVLKFIMNNPRLTDSEIYLRMGYKNPNAIRPRRRSLVQYGLIKESGKRICSVSKMRVYCWVVDKEITMTKFKEKKSNSKTRVKCPMCKGEGYLNKGQTTLNWGEI